MVWTFDGVVYDFHSAFRFLAVHQFGLYLPPIDELFSHWDGHLRYLTKEQDDWIWTEGINQGLFRHGHVRKGAIAFTRELDTLADIVIITHRPRQARQDTLDWLAFNRIPAKEIHLLEGGEPKYTINSDVLLDDKYENVRDFQLYRGTGLLWTRPWNGEYKATQGWYRMKLWQEVLDWVRTQ